MSYKEGSMETYQSSQLVQQLIIRVPKTNSVFTYFTLEACDNLCFYSTLDHVKGQNYRDIIITSTIEFGDEVKRVINRLSDSYSIEILEEKVFAK